MLVLPGVHSSSFSRVMPSFLMLVSSEVLLKDPRENVLEPEDEAEVELQESVACPVLTVVPGLGVRQPVHLAISTSVRGASIPWLT